MAQLYTIAQGLIRGGWKALDNCFDLSYEIVDLQKVTNQIEDVYLQKMKETYMRGVNERSVCMID